jgi:hypothetical protein
VNTLRLTLFFAALTLTSAARAAEPCDAPGARDLTPLRAAIASDELVAQAFEATANACPPVPEAGCDDAKLKCADALANNLKKMIGFDEGTWVRDMLLPYLGQSYKPTVVLPTVVTPATDVSCSADHLTLRAAAQRRRQQAERRKLVAGEYQKWQVWAVAVRQTCQDKVKAQKEQQDVANAEAARLAAAAAAAKTAEEQRQADLRKAEEARQAELKRAQQAQEEAKKTEAQRKLDAEKEQQRKQAEAEAVARSKAEQQAVNDREARKRAQEQKVEELKAKEELRRQEADDQLKQQKLTAQAEHDKKIERLKRDLALSEEEKAKAVAAEEEKFKVAEDTRRRNAEAEIAKVAKIDRTDERMKGNLALHAVGGISLLNGALGGALGAHLRVRIAFWGLAPADGMASGFEFKPFATFLASPGATTSFLQFEGGAELRGWYRRLGFGISGSFDYLGTTVSSDDGTGVSVAVPCPSAPVGTSNPCTGASSFALGPVLAVAIVDNPNQQFIIGARWIPTFQGDLLRFASEFEIAFDWFSLTLQAGLKEDARGFDATGARQQRLGFWVVAGLGGRLRW